MYGESDKAYRYLLNKIVQYVKEEFPQNIGSLDHFTKQKGTSAEGTVACKLNPKWTDYELN